MQFRNLKKAEITPQSTSKFVFYDLEGEPWLTVRPAHEINKPYFNALLKRNTSGNRRRVNRVIDAAAIERDRSEARELYGKHITNVGPWGGWVDEAGLEIPLTQATVEALMQNLPPEQFDQLRVYCADLSNFRVDPIDPDGAEETGKNS